MGVNEGPLGNQRRRKAGIVCEHVGRNDPERLKPIGGRDIGADALGAIQVAAVRVQAELVHVANAFLLLQRSRSVRGVESADGVT